ncbi:MAG: hypothetical protein GMKNLPBB_01562 [Myxococcota bacterium]|nr:hypothetical protein [Myxococcota bacterium]
MKKKNSSSKAKRKLNRREFIRLSAGATVALPLALQACASDGESMGDAGVPAGDAGTGGGDSGAADAAPKTPNDNAKTVEFNAAAIKQDDGTFSLGVQSGAMTANSALVWGYTSDNAPKTLRVWREINEPGKVALVHEMSVTPADGYLKQKVEGLAAGEWYHFAWLSGGGGFGARSIIGKFRTAVAADYNGPIELAATTCTNIKNTPYQSLLLTAKQEYDFFCHLGDFSYNDGSRTKQEFRNKWRATLNDPGYRQVLSKTGAYITWDDHEIDDNSVLYKLPPEVLKDGKDAFFETVAVERGDNDRLWWSYRWGKTAEVFVLDSRLERKVETAGKPDATYISKEQMEWFKKGLVESPCHFKIVLNSVPMIDWPKIWIMESDRWEGYQAQREELLKHIESNGVRNVWWLSGDFHVGAVARLEASGPRGKMWEILVGPGANGPNPLQALVEADPKQRRQIYPDNQFKYGGGAFAATLMRFDPESNSVRVRFLDAKTGASLFDETLTEES